ncbi:MAG: ATP-binding cassette domain-containing protein [Polyangiaceae bacterium]
MSDSAAPSLVVRDLSVSVHGRPLLGGISFELARTGLSWLVGPVASGKTTLLRAIAGWFRGVEGFDVTGAVESPRPVRLVGLQPDALLQSPLEAVASTVFARATRTLAETHELAAFALTEVGLGALRSVSVPVAELPIQQRRLVGIAQAVAAEVGVLMLDEPTASLPSDARAMMLRVLDHLSFGCGVVVVSHNQLDLRALGGDVLFLAGGQILERGDAAGFLASPRTADGRRFVETGGSATPSLALATARAREPRAPATWIKWVLPDRLAGMHRPGLLRALDVDLETLADAGFSVLVCLEELLPYDTDVVRAFGFELVHVPIADMQAPRAEELGSIAELIRARMNRGARVAVHCRAGLGRTGTVLAAVQVLAGLSAEAAVRDIRRAEPRFIQSEAQLEALHRLVASLAGSGGEGGSLAGSGGEGGSLAGSGGEGGLAGSGGEGGSLAGS